MRKIPQILTLTLMLAIFASCATAQDEQPGKTMTYSINPASCGATGGNYGEFPLLNCYGIPFSLKAVPAGTTWIYTSYNASTQKPYGWGFFYGSTDVAGTEYTVTSSSMNPLPSTFTAPLPPYPTGPLVCKGNCSTFTATITGTTPDDGGSYSSTLTLDLYYYRGCSSGRGGGCRTDVLVTGGTLKVTYE
jgi:hypothetical protein